MFWAHMDESWSLPMDLQSGEKENRLYLFRSRHYNVWKQMESKFDLSSFKYIQKFWTLFQVIDNTYTIFLFCFLPLAFPWELIMEFKTAQIEENGVFCVCLFFFFLKNEHCWKKSILVIFGFYIKDSIEKCCI